MFFFASTNFLPELHSVKGIMKVRKGVKKSVLKPKKVLENCSELDKVHERIDVVHLTGDINTVTFGAILGKELYWLWTKEDKEANPLCSIKADIRMVTPTKVSIDPELYKITFRCGMTRNVSVEQLYQGCIKHNLFVTNTSNGMVMQRSKALHEGRRSLFNADGQYRNSLSKNDCNVTGLPGNEAEADTAANKEPGVVPSSTLPQASANNLLPETNQPLQVSNALDSVQEDSDGNGRMCMDAENMSSEDYSDTNNATSDPVLTANEAEGETEANKDPGVVPSSTLPQESASNLMPETKDPSEVSKALGSKEENSSAHESMSVDDETNTGEIVRNIVQEIIDVITTGTQHGTGETITHPDCPHSTTTVPVHSLSQSTTVQGELFVEVTEKLSVDTLRDLLAKAKQQEKDEKKKQAEVDGIKRKRVAEAKAAWREAVAAAKPMKKVAIEPPKAKKTKLSHDNDSEDDSQDDCDGFSGILSDEENDNGKRSRGKLTRVQKWINGNRDMRKRKSFYIARSTCNTAPEGLVLMKKYGFAIVNNMNELFDAANQPDKYQRDYIHTVPNAEKNIIFESVELSDESSSVTPHYDKDHVHARRQLKDIRKDSYKEFKSKYAGQQEDIIRGMFEGMAGITEHWKLNWNVLVGGVNHQHPHTDTASRASSYEGLDVFPFVAIHGFNLDAFSLWILPDPLHCMYGFMHTFERHQILFMRGDMVHAGVPSRVPRGHMEFFPTPHAGWVKRSAYWMRKDYKQTAFPWQHPTYPFGYPNVGLPNDQGKQLMSYPPDITHYLQHKHKEAMVAPEMRAGERQKKKKIKQAMLAQLGTY